MSRGQKPVQGVPRAEAARKLGCSKASVTRMAQRGALRTFDDGSIDPRDVDPDIIDRERQQRALRSLDPSRPFKETRRSKARAGKAEWPFVERCIADYDRWHLRIARRQRLDLGPPTHVPAAVVDALGFVTHGAWAGTFEGHAKTLARLAGIPDERAQEIIERIMESRVVDMFHWRSANDEIVNRDLVRVANSRPRWVAKPLN